MQGRNRNADVKNRQVDTGGEEEDGTNWEMEIDIGTLLRLLGHFRQAGSFVTLWTAARQAPPSMGISR